MVSMTTAPGHTKGAEVVFVQQQAALLTESQKCIAKLQTSNTHIMDAKGFGKAKRKRVHGIYFQSFQSSLCYLHFREYR